MTERVGTVIRQHVIAAVAPGAPVGRYRMDAHVQCACGWIGDGLTAHALHVGRVVADCLSDVVGILTDALLEDDPQFVVSHREEIERAVDMLSATDS